MLNILELNMITRVMQQAKKLTEENKAVLDGINLIFNSSGGMTTSVTQAELDEHASLSGLTVQELNDAVYGLTQIQATLTNSYQQLTKLAIRA